jgi:hypothetical protein
VEHNAKRYAAPAEKLEAARKTVGSVERMSMAAASVFA